MQKMKKNAKNAKNAKNTKKGPFLASHFILPIVYPCIPTNQSIVFYIIS